MSSDGLEGTTEHIVRKKAGEVVFTEGDTGTEMYIIQDGQVEIVSLQRGEMKRQALLDKGDFFGEIGMLENLPRASSARAVTEAVLLRIDNTTFNQIIHRNPDIAVRMLRKMCRRLREATAAGVVMPPAARMAEPARAERSPEATVPASVVEPVRPAPEPAKVESRPKPAGVTRPMFVEESTRKEFPIEPGKDNLVGRPEAATGFHPEIDLKDVDTKRSISRRHARIIPRGTTFVLREEPGVGNGTFVNGKRIAPGVEVELHDGDNVSFGSVRTTFYTGQ